MQVNNKELGELIWLTGSWKGASGETVMEEFWTSPGGGLMLGLHRDIRPSKKAFFEYLRIEARADGIFYVASPLGKGATDFRLKEHSSTKATFENPEHDFPQRIIYSLESKDRLKARIEGEQGGKQRSSEWVWDREK